MTAALTLPHGGLELLPPWLRGADPRDGIRVRVDGTTTLHTGGLPEPSYRVDVLGEDCAVELVCDGVLLRLSCLPDEDGPARAPRPGPRFGWSAEGLDADARPHVIPARAADAVAACAGDQEAAEAVAAITRWVAAEAALRAKGLDGDGPAARRAAAAWRADAERLRGALAGARRLRHVPVRPLRDEFVRQCARGELTAMALARRLGWRGRPGDERADGARVLRRLALIPQPSARRPRGVDEALTCGQLEVRAQLRAATARVTYETAVALCRALGRDPADLGL